MTHFLQPLTPVKNPFPLFLFLITIGDKCSSDTTYHFPTCEQFNTFINNPSSPSFTY